MNQGALPDLPALPAGWCCYVLLCSDGSYDCGITSNLPQHVRESTCRTNSGKAPHNQPIAVVWYEAAKQRRNAAIRQQQIKGWNEGRKRNRAGRCVPFEGSGNNVWIPLVSIPSSAK